MIYTLQSITLQSFNVQKIAVLGNRSRINEKSQLTVNNRQQLNDSEVTRSTQSNFKFKRV